MPGNEVGDRIHNFFDQESVSQGQQHSQVVDGSWPGLSVNPWAASQAQLGFSQFSNIKNHNLQQSADTERGHGGQSSSEQHGVNLSQSLLRPEFSINQSHSQGPTLNGYAHGHQVFQRRQNEGNVLGMDMEFDQHSQISQGFSVPDSRLETIPELNRANYVSSTEAMVNYDFFGGQQQMSSQLSSQHHGILQPLSQQQLGINGMHLSTEQAILKRMQEIQMHQQFQKQQLQQQEVRQLNSVNHLSSYVKQSAGGQSSPLINGIPVQGATNYSSQPEHMMANKNWPQHVASPVTRGSSGLMFYPQQPRSLGLFPQHPNQSLYGLPVSGTTITSDRQSPSHRDRNMVQQLSSSNTSFHVNQYNGKMDQDSMQNGSFLSKQGYQGQNMFGTTTQQGGQDLNNVLNLGNLVPVNSQEINGTVQGYRTQDDLVGPSETPRVKTNMEVASLGNVATLDPTEEKILFGSDDNLWGAFGRETNMSSGLLDGNDFGAYPSMQSGSWSALMQSAVAETSSTENGPQEGCGFHSSDTPAENWKKQMPNDSGKHQSTLADNTMPTAPTINSRINPGSSDTNPSINFSSNFPGVGQSGKSSATQLDRLQSETNHNYIQHFTGDGTNKWIDRNPLKKAVVEDGHVLGKVNEEVNTKNHSFSWKDQQSTSPFNDVSQLSNRPNANGWNFINHVSPSNLVVKDQENEHPPHSGNDRKSSMVRALGYGGIQKTDSLSNLNSEMEHAKPVIDSAANLKGDKVAGNFRSDMVKNQRSFESVGNHNSENAQLDAFDSHTKSKSSAHPVHRKFHYHPMGDVDVDEQRHGSRLIASPFSQGLKAHDQGFNRHSNNPTHLTRNSVETEKGSFPGFHEDRRGTEKIPSKSISSNSSTSTSAPFDRSAGSYPNRGAASSQNMLELLHKVDEAGEHANAAHVMPSDLNQTYELPEEETSDGSVHLRHNHSSMPQGYGLQLAPPSQMSSFSLPHVASGISLQKINSLDTASDSPVVGVKGSPVQSSREISQGQPRSNVSLSQGQPGNEAQRNHFAINSPNFLSSRSSIKSQNMHETCGGVLIGENKGQTDEPVTASKDPAMLSNVLDCDITSSAEQPQFNSKNQDYSRYTNQQFPVLEAAPFHPHSSLPSSSQEVATSKLSHKDHSYGAQAFKAPSDLFKYNVPTTSKAETFPSQPQRLVGENAQRVAYVSKDSANCFVGNEVAERSTTSQVKGVSHFQPGASPLNSSNAQKEIEAFGRSLRANTVMPQTYSLQQQVQAIQSLGVDPRKSNLQRFKAPDGDLGSPPLASHVEKQVSEHKNSTDALPANCSSGPSEDPNTLNVAESTEDKSNLPPQDTQNSAYNGANTPRGQPQVSPQMAPSWFNQFGTFKNGQIALSDTWKTANIKPMKLPATIEKPSDSQHSHDLTNQGTAIAADASQNNNILNRLSRHATENPGSLQFLHPEAAIKPKKRKTLASEFVPWHEKVMEGSSGLEDISMAEANWARETNRLTEKVEDDYEVVEAGPPAIRSKRRLVLTTQLMQLLLDPPPASVRSADAKSQYENVAYFVARSILGDACSILSCSRSDAPVPFEDGPSMNSQACERIRDQYLSKVMEDLINRARKVESDLLRLDKGASLADLRVECQELEKYSVINRFAKFHSRSQADAAESSSINNSASKAKRSGQERYAVMIPMPKNLPDGVQCLSL